MHYSALNAVNAASPASASPSSSSLSPVGSSHVSSHYHHLTGNEQSQMSHHHELMAMSESMSSPQFNGANATSKSNESNLCDDLATTYTTLQSASSGNTHNGTGHYSSTPDQHMGGQGPNGSTPKTGTKRSAPSTTATKSTYSNGGKANGAASNGTASAATGRANTGGGKKTKGRVKIKMEFIDNKLRRYTTFSKRKTGIMKKAYELSTLTGTQVMLLVASETGHVYTFATRKLQPMITSDAGKALIQTCLNSPDPSGLMNGSGPTPSVASGPDVVTTNGHVSSLVSSNSSTQQVTSHSLNNSNEHNQHSNDLSRMLGTSGPGSISGCSTPNTVIDQRMSATGFEETELSYSVSGEDCSPLNDKGIFSGCLTIGTNSLVNSAPGTASNGLLRPKNGPPPANFFINETPGMGQGSDEDDDDDEEEEDDEEEPEEEEEDPELDPDIAYLAGLHGLDSDLSRLIGSSPTSTPILLNDAMLSSGLWAQPPPMPKPTALTQPANPGFVSDRTKMNLNLKLQQKQQMQRTQQQQQQNMRTQMAQPRPAQQQFNVNLQQQQPQPGSSKVTPNKVVHPKSANTLKNSANGKKPQPSNSRSTSKSCAVTSSSQSTSNSSLILGNSSALSSSSSFVNFDPASFLDSCFNTNSTDSNSPESNSLLDSSHSLDQMLQMNSGELLLLNQPNQSNQTMSTEQQFNLMMMIGGNGGNQMSSQSTNTQFSTATSKPMPSSGLKSTAKGNLNSAARVSSSQLFSSRPNTSLPQVNTFQCPPKQMNASGSFQQSLLSSPSAFNSMNNNFTSPTSKQLTSSIGSLVGCVTSSSSKQQQQQSKAANLNAIINNLASANTSASSTGVHASGGSHNTGNLDGNTTLTSQNRATGGNGMTLLDQSGHNGPNGLNQFGAMAAAAQQLLSGNIILCTTPTSTITLPSLDQSGTSGPGTNCPTSNGPTQLFSLGPSHSGGNNSDTSTTLLLPANIQTSGLSIHQSPNGSQSGGGQNSLGHNQQLIYNAFSGLAGRILYQTAPTTGQGQMNNSRSMDGSGHGTGTNDGGGQTFSTLITADGQQLILNVANASTNSIAQLVTPNSLANQQSDSSSRLRIKQECHSQDGNTSSTISFLPQGHTLLHQDLQHSISLDSLLGGPNLGPSPAPLISTFQSTLTPVSSASQNLFNSPKPPPGAKKQRSK